MTKPTFIPPMLATLVGGPFDDPDWLFEVKWDGFRVEAVVDGGGVRLWTRGEKDAAQCYFGPFLDPPTWIDARSRRSSTARSSRSTSGASPTSRCCRPGSRAGERPPSRRRSSTRSSTCSTSTAGRCSTSRSRSAAACSRTSSAPDPRVRLSEHIEGDGIAFFEAARVRGLEGIMAKDRRSPYVPGKRTDRWQKIKIRPEQELVVGGWVKGTGKAVDLGALLVGVYEDGALRYAGKVGAGFTNGNRAELLAAVAPLAADEPPFATPPPTAGRARRPVAAPGARHPGRVRRLDRRRPRPPGRVQGHRAREGPARRSSASARRADRADRRTGECRRGRISTPWRRVGRGQLTVRPHPEPRYRHARPTVCLRLPENGPASALALPPGGLAADPTGRGSRRASVMRGARRSTPCSRARSCRPSTGSRSGAGSIPCVKCSTSSRTRSRSPRRACRRSLATTWSPGAARSSPPTCTSRPARSL